MITPIASTRTQPRLPGGTVGVGAGACVAISATGGCRSCSTKRVKKSSASFAAAPSTSRLPICASLPPTCALTAYDSDVWLSGASASVTFASPFAKPAAPPCPSNLSR